MSAGNVAPLREPVKGEKEIPPPRSRREPQQRFANAKAREHRRNAVLAALSSDEKLHFSICVGVLSEGVHVGRAKIDEAFSRALTLAFDLAKLDYAGARQEMVKVRRIERRIQDLDPEQRSKFAQDRFQQTVKRDAILVQNLKGESQGLKLIEIVKRLAKALERNGLTFLEVRQPSVFIFNGGRITVSSYRAPERRTWGEKKAAPPEEPLPIETLDVRSVSDIPHLLESAVPVVLV